MKKLVVGGLTLAMAATVLSGCSSTVSYQDPNAVETVSVDYGATDLQSIASTMADDMLSSPNLVKLTATRQPVLFVDSIRNKTSEHIDTQSITDSIETKLINSGKFRFVDMTKVKAVRQQLQYQHDSGMVDQATAVQLGKQIGAEFMLYGNLSSIVKSNSSVKDVYYKMTMKLMNLKTGIVVWAGEKQIRKQRKKSFLGW
ncbi:penicillin-binding protein activator LpoB [Dongshaea marina]|uniref:penicillin-binding protein activator LpoB n=1 Tax=Dongshaea marina TaxID=2047966 RepID=UPI000D3EDBBA|nr:penicillin-binding protein activator LpoB [Dongshaea marina]